MERFVEFLKGAAGVSALCGVLFLSMEAIDGSLSSFKLPTGAAQAAQPSESSGPPGPVADYFPSQYENQAKDTEELPAQFDRHFDPLTRCTTLRTGRRGPRTML